MPTTCIYFLPAAPGIAENSLPSQMIFNALVADHQLDPLPGWTMAHTLYRESNLGSNAVLPGYLQVLTLSHHERNSYIATSRTVAAKSGEGHNSTKTTIVKIPTSGGSDEFTMMLNTRFTPLWQRRQVTHINNGQAYEIGPFNIRFGEVRETRTGSGGVQPIRGTLIEIIASEELEPSAEDAIRMFWSDIEVPGAKEYMANSSTSNNDDALQKWLEALRIRT